MYCISVSHKKAPVAIREKFAFTAEEKEEFTHLLLSGDSVNGCVILCTCNRSEIYVSGKKPAASDLQRLLSEYKKIQLEELLKYLNIYGGDNAIRHLFRVCCGFDSMVLGEDEILGQVKDAYQAALALKAADYELNVLFQKAVTCAKKIKTDTRLSKTPLSIATLAANEVFHFEKEGLKKVMVIGLTGKMGSTIAKNILSKPGILVFGTVRSHKTGLKMETRDERVRIIDYRDRYRYMDEMDIVISATSGPHYTVTYEELSAAVGISRPRLFIDVAVPVDMDPEIQKIDGLVLHDIDFFEALSKNNTEIKLKELDRAQAIMEEELDGAVKEVVFHPFMKQIPSLRQVFEEKPLDTILYQIRDHVTSEELKVIIRTFNRLEGWIREG